MKINEVLLKNFYEIYCPQSIGSGLVGEPHSLPYTVLNTFVNYMIDQIQYKHIIK